MENEVSTLRFHRYVRKQGKGKPLTWVVEVGLVASDDVADVGHVGFVFGLVDCVVIVVS